MAQLDADPASFSSVSLMLDRPPRYSISAMPFTIGSGRRTGDRQSGLLSFREPDDQGHAGTLRRGSGRSWRTDPEDRQQSYTIVLMLPTLDLQRHRVGAGVKRRGVAPGGSFGGRPWVLNLRRVTIDSCSGPGCGLPLSLLPQSRKPRQACLTGPSKRSWRRPTLPQPLDCSTIGAAGLNFRVRNGNGCGPCALVASHFQGYSLLAIGCFR